MPEGENKHQSADWEAYSQPSVYQRRVYVIHGGFLSGQKNHAACDIQEALIQRGIPAEDIVVLKSCYCDADDLSPPCPPTGEFHEKPPGLWDCLYQWGKTLCALVKNGITYLDASLPETRTSRNAYNRLKKALPAPAAGQKLNVTYIGYSGGGQLGLTMAALAEHDPEINLDRVITLGSPILWNTAPAKVSVTNYVSTGDWVLQGASCLPLVSLSAPNPDANDTVVPFGDNIHHFAWSQHPEVMNHLTFDLQRRQGSVPPVRPTLAPAVTPQRLLLEAPAY